VYVNEQQKYENGTIVCFVNISMKDKSTKYLGAVNLDCAYFLEAEINAALR
jgi:hypothetical protein